MTYYENPSELSESLHYNLLKMLGAPSDEIFLEIVDMLFRAVYETEKHFIKAMQEKDKFVLEHQDLMKKLFEKSSSDESEDFRELISEQKMKRPSISSERKLRDH